MTVDVSQMSDEELEYRISEIRAEQESRKPKFELGKMPNKRAGFYHIHSASHECGQAYWENANDYDYPNKGEYKPCKKLVNHDGYCGFEDNTAF